MSGWNIDANVPSPEEAQSSEIWNDNVESDGDVEEQTKDVFFIPYGQKTLLHNLVHTSAMKKISSWYWVSKCEAFKPR